MQQAREETHTDVRTSAPRYRRETKTKETNAEPWSLEREGVKEARLERGGVKEARERDEREKWAA